MQSPFENYSSVNGAFDELVGTSRSSNPDWDLLKSAVESMGIEELKRRTMECDESFKARGITFSLGGQERTFPLDPIPRIVTAQEWSVVSMGLIQRMRAIETFLDDIYGSGEILRDRIVPRRLIVGSSQFSRRSFGISNPHGVRVTVAGLDLVRDETGKLCVLEDNLRTPSGISYVLENRRAMARILPELFESYEIEPVSDYPSKLLGALLKQAPPGRRDPLVVLLTPGIYNSAYFEHSFLARQMGIPLVEGRDMFCRGNEVFVRTTDGDLRVDVIYRRIDDDYLDPQQFLHDSGLGIPGVVNAARANNVVIANAIGNGVADDKLLYSYVPELIDYYLHERPILPNVDTYRLEDPDVMEFVLERLDSLVLKPVDASGGKGVVMGPTATEFELETVAKQLSDNPRGWIAQRLVNFSTIPTMVGSNLQPRHADLRPFIISSPDGHWVVPGGLTRVALPEGSMIVNSSQGGGSKDTWVLAPKRAASPITIPLASYEMPPLSFDDLAPMANAPITKEAEQ